MKCWAAAANFICSAGILPAFSRRKACAKAGRMIVAEFAFEISVTAIAAAEKIPVVEATIFQLQTFRTR
jgi:hypothetical protein